MFLIQNIDLQFCFPFLLFKKGNSVVRKSLFDLRFQNQTVQPPACYLKQMLKRNWKVKLLQHCSMKGVIRRIMKPPLEINSAVRWNFWTLKTRFWKLRVMGWFDLVLWNFPISLEFRNSKFEPYQPLKEIAKRQQKKMPRSKRFANDTNFWKTKKIFLWKGQMDLQLVQSSLSMKNSILVRNMKKPSRTRRTAFFKQYWRSMA